MNLNIFIMENFSEVAILVNFIKFDMVFKKVFNPADLAQY